MNWKYKDLIDVCGINLGKTPSRSNKRLWDINKIGNNKWVSIADLTKVRGRYLSDTKEYISDEGAKLFNHVKPNTILMSFKLSIGKLAITKEKIYTNEAIVALPIKNNKELNQNFLYYYLEFYDWEKESNNDVKVKGKTLNKDKLKKIKIPIPPLPIQQKIGEKLDAIFAEIDKATAAVEANIKNVEVLFKSYLKKEFEKMTILYGKKPIEYFCDDIFAGGDVPKDAFSKIITSEYSIPIIANAEKNNGLYGYTNKPRVIKPSLTIAGRGSVGHTEIRTEPFFPIVRLIVLTPNSNLIKLKFLNYSVLSLKIQSLGSVIPQLTIPMIKSYFIPNTPISEQDIFIKKIDNIFNETIKIKSIEKRKIEKFNFLKQSILKQAFNGELVKAA